jgi:hypothetical protein
LSTDTTHVPLSGSGMWKTLPTANFLSYFAIAIVEFAIPFVAVTQLGATALVVAILGVARFAPQVLLAGIAARLVNRLNQRRILVLSELFRVAAFGIAASALLVSNSAALAVFIVASIAMAWASTLTAISTQVVVPAMFAGRDLSKMYSRLSIAETLGDGTAPFLAGLGIAAIGTSGTFAISAVLALAACSLLLRVPKLLVADEAAAAPRAGGLHTSKSGIRNGVAINFGSPSMAILTCWAVAYNLGQSIIEPLVLLSLLASTPLTATSYGVMRSAAVLFAVLGAILSDRLPVVLRNGRGIALFGIGAIGSYSLVAVGVNLGDIAGLIFTFAGFALDEFCSGVVLVLLQTYRGSSIALSDRADAASVFRAVCLMAVPVGLLTGGVAGTVLEPNLLILIVGLAMIIPGLPLLSAKVRSIRIAT